MKTLRQIEIFSAGCPVCKEAVAFVKGLACPSCEVTVLDMKKPEVSKKVKDIGIRSVPAVVIDGQLADCCGRGLDEDVLKTAGLGKRCRI